MKNFLIASLLTGSVIGSVAGCADEDPCANGACTLEGRTTVKWTFNAYPQRGFGMDSCVDFGVQKVKVELVHGTTGDVQHFEEDCSIAQVSVSGLAPGDYTAFVTPLDAAGNPLIDQLASGIVTAGSLGDNREITVNVPWDAWVGTFTGTFLFRLSWGGLSCESATPEIKSQVLTLVVNGVVQSIVTDDGQMLNGADKKPCKRLTDNFPQSALGVPFGPATLLVEGYDATDNMAFAKEFETFVGAGITNPTLTFDVPLL